MRILAFTAGAASMYCGSCLRDNALAAELLRMDHQVTLLPIYTPTLTDEVNVSSRHVVFGGISVYLQHYLKLFRHTPRFLDRLWDSGLALRAASRRSIPVDPKLLGEMTVSMLEGESGPQHKEFGKLLDWLRREPAPDVVTLPNSLLIALAAPLRRAFSKPVLCTLQGEDLFLEQLAEPYRSRSFALIRSHFAAVDGFIAVSEFGADLMSRLLGIPRERIHVVPLGIHADGFPVPRPSRTPPAIGYFARVAPEKSLHLLAEAYVLLRRKLGFGEARLEAGGYLAPEHQPYLDGVRRTLRGAGLESEFVYHGAPSRREKLEFLSGLDVLAAPSVYAEPKGLYVLEAMACGVPVAAPDHGAFPEMIRAAGGGVLFEPGNAGALAEALQSLLADPARAAEMGARGAAGVRERYSVQRMAERAAAVYSSFCR